MSDPASLATLWSNMETSPYSPYAQTVNTEKPYIPQARDVVSQLICGLGFRVSSGETKREGRLE